MFRDSHPDRILIQDGMSKAPQNLTSLPPDAQAFMAAQAAELADLKQELLGLTLTY